MPAALLPVSDADRAAFRRQNDAVLVERLRQGLLVGAAVGVILMPATKLQDPALELGFVLIPGVASGIMVAASLAIRRPGVVATALYCGCSYAVAALGAILAARTGGFQSPYFLIHFLISTFVTAFLPLSPWRLLLACVPNLLITPAIIILDPFRTDTYPPGSDMMLLPVLLSASGLVFAWLGVVLRHQVDLQSFVAHARLAETRASLAALNDELERRVEEQVGEIVRRADDIDALNALLRDKVQARSRELARALRALKSEAEVGALEVGAELGGRVVLEGTIGAGGMGTVYVGHDRVSGRRVAVKVMSAGVRASPRAIQRFLAEAEAAAAIAHPGIVKTLHVDVTADGTPFLIMEYVEGAPLNLIARRSGKLAPRLVAHLGEAIARALAAAHAVGIVHRDVKPSNVMIARQPPAVRLLDFGVSKMERGDADTHLTATGALIGTPAYMAPEQVRGSSGPACDIYSLGVVLYELAAGRHPFATGDPMALLIAHASEEPTPLDVLDPAIPSALARLVAAAMAKPANARPGGLVLADALAGLTAGVCEATSLYELLDAESVRLDRDAIRTADGNDITGLTTTAP